MGTLQPFIFIVAGAGLLLILGGVIASVRSGSAPQVDDRLTRYTSGSMVVEETTTVEEAPERTSVLADRLEKAVAGRGFAANIKGQLQQADLKLRVSEYLALIVIAVISVAGIAWFVFDRSIIFGILGGVVGFFAPRMFVKQTASKRRKDFDNLLSDTLNLWVNALRSGYSVLQAMETIAAETPPPINTEFERVVQEVRLGLTLEEALDNLMIRIPSDDMDLVVTAVNVQREVGGNLAEVLSTISHTIRERIRIKGEIMVLTAQVMVSGYIISFLPIALVLFLRLSNPEYIGELFVKDSPWVVPGVVPCGWVVLGIGLMLIASGFFALRKIADIEI